MALEVTASYDSPTSTTPFATTYWRWVGLGIDVTRASATVTLYGYVDAASFAAGKQNVGQKQYTISDADFLALAGEIDGPTPVGVSHAIYAHVKAKDPFFAAATDV